MTKVSGPPKSSLRIKMVATDKLVPYARNARLHDDAHVAQIAASIAEFGFTNPVLLQPDLTIIAGHGRVLAARSLGLAKVPTIALAGMTEEKAKALRIADNKLALNATWDADLLKLELEELKELGTDLKVMGFTNDELLTVFGDVPEPTEEPDTAILRPPIPETQRGEVIELGDHRLMCGDCRDINDVTKLMDAHKADLVYTDPPYGVEYTGGWNCERERLEGDEVGTDIYADSLPLMAAFAKDKAAWYLWHAGSSVDTVMIAATALRAAGLEIRAQIVWVKNNAQMGSFSQYHHKHEPCFYAHRKGKSPVWCGPNNEVTVWECDRANKNEFHPTQKPVNLAVRAITNSSKPGGLVMDMFMGSGATLIAAEKMGRRCYGMEIDPGYCDVIRKRYEAFIGARTEDPAA